MVKTAAFFDIDGTLVRGASTWYLARDLLSQGYFGLDFFLFTAWQPLPYVVFDENKHRLAMVRERSLWALKGKLESDLIPVGEELYDRFLQEHFFPDTLEIIQKYLGTSREVWLVFITPREISQQIVYRPGLIGGLGTVVEADENGHYTGKIPQSLFHEAMGAQTVRDLARERHLDLSNCYVYPDSMSGEKLFNLVGHSCVINPEWRLRDLARHRHWPIYDFVRRHLSVALVTRTTLLSVTIVGSVWTAKVLWCHVLKHLSQIPARAWRRRRKN